MEWKSPGRQGAVAYALAAVLLGGLMTVVTRLRIAGVRGRRRVARQLPDGPIIIVSNHAGYADGVLLALACRRMGRSVRLLATGGVFTAPILGRLVERVGFIRVDRGSTSAASALDRAAEALAAGEAVGIFPEGRTTRDPHHWPERAKTGAVRLSLRTDAPIVPVAMVGSHRIAARGKLIRSILTSVVLRPKVLVEVGAPIDLRTLTSAEHPAPAEIRRLSDLVMDRLVELVAEIRGEQPPLPAERG